MAHASLNIWLAALYVQHTLVLTTFDDLTKPTFLGPHYSLVTFGEHLLNPPLMQSHLKRSIFMLACHQLQNVEIDAQNFSAEITTHGLASRSQRAFSCWSHSVFAELQSHLLHLLKLAFVSSNCGTGLNVAMRFHKIWDIAPYQGISAQFVNFDWQRTSLMLG